MGFLNAHGKIIQLQIQDDVISYTISIPKDCECCFVVLINAPDLDDLDETPMYSHYLDDQQKYMCVRVLT